LEKIRREAKLLYLIRQISTELVEKFIELGGHKCDSPADVGKAAAAVVVVLSHPDQIQDVIFGDEGVMKGLQKDAVLLLSSTISTLQLQKLEKQLTGFNLIL
jgi:3-hydroxyisobutyrate dehydrogenase-like beta-hydroxyacid dehydrogenase